MWPSIFLFGVTHLTLEGSLCMTPNNVIVSNMLFYNKLGGIFTFWLMVYISNNSIPVKERIKEKHDYMVVIA